MVMELLGKMLRVKPGTKPITEGPSKMPVMTSAITLGSGVTEESHILQYSY